MKIVFRQQAELTEREIMHLVQLFFEDVELKLERMADGPVSTATDAVEKVNDGTEKHREEGQESFDQEAPVVHILAVVEETGDNVVARVQLSIGEEEPAASYTYQKELAQSISAREKRRLRKQSVAHALVKVLERWTGLNQPWGILTGVRPTKLMHRFRREGRTERELREHFEEHLLVKPEKRLLLEEIVKKQLEVVPDFDQIDQEVSIYIGIPFCPTKCAYCTFPAYAINRKGSQVDQFLRVLEEEMKEIGDWLARNQLKITSIYFGGGTPTSIEAEELDRLFQVMQDHFHSFNGVRELTVEAGRPDTITREKLEVLRKWQVDRISINPQSFTQKTLEAIGRHHTVEEVLEKYALARKHGLNNINMDLIIGLPGEGVKELEHSLSEIEKLRPESLTIHTLSFKRASTLTKNKEKYQVAERKEIQEMMDLATRWTKERGYHPYYLYRQKNILGNLENVGYAQQGYESIYNIMIMEEAQTIIGLGCGAVSKILSPHTKQLTRWPNPKDPYTYVSNYGSMIKQKIEVLDQLYGTALIRK